VHFKLSQTDFLPCPVTDVLPPNQRIPTVSLFSLHLFPCPLHTAVSYILFGKFSDIFLEIKIIFTNCERLTTAHSYRLNKGTCIHAQNFSAHRKNECDNKKAAHLLITGDFFNFSFLVVLFLTAALRNVLFLSHNCLKRFALVLSLCIPLWFRLVRVRMLTIKKT
jgi:hypothetical protein